MIAAGFDIKPTQSAIVAVMLYDAPLSQKFAAKMAEEGIFVTGFYYPVVRRDRLESGFSSPPLTRKSIWTKPLLPS
jgi:7-keto-8-aminopelargonate synthetase-like enzyme